MRLSSRRPGDPIGGYRLGSSQLMTAAADCHRHRDDPLLKVPPATPELIGASCKGAPTGLFFADDPAPALALCHSCPVQAKCLAFALSHRLEGVWGGTTDADRRRLRRNREAS